MDTNIYSNTLLDPSVVTVLIVTLIATLVGTLLATALIHLYKRHISDHVRVVRIKSSKSIHADALLDLYEEVFPENNDNDYSRVEMEEVLDEKFTGDKFINAENIVLSALWKGDVVGLLFCHFYPNPHKAIISYYAITPNRRLTRARAEAPIKMLKKLKVVLKRKDCSHVFFELEGTDQSGTPKAILNHKTKSVAFANRAKTAFNLKSGMFTIDYKAPRVSLEKEHRESIYTLHVMSLNGETPSVIGKKDMLSFLKFIFFYCYADIYDVNDPLSKIYQKYLEDHYSHYEKTLPDEIGIKLPRRH